MHYASYNKMKNLLSLLPIPLYNVGGGWEVREGALPVLCTAGPCVQNSVLHVGGAQLR